MQFERVHVTRRRGAPELDGTVPSQLLPIQREGYTLSPPSLIQPKDSATNYHLGGDQHLTLSPEFLALVQRQLDDQLDVAKLRPALGKVNYAAPGLPRLPTPGQAAATGTPGTIPAADPKSVPPVPQPEPLVPRGEGPEKPRSAEISDIAEAIAAIPAIENGLSTLKTEAKAKATADWGKLKPGEKAAVVTTVVSIAIGALGGAATDPGARSFLLGQLNGKILPVPKVPWLNVEVNTEGGNMMVGLHVDVGQLLPPSLGFGPGSPDPIGGPPVPEPSPWQRAVASDAAGTMGGAGPPAGLHTADRVRALAGLGAPLPASVRHRFESELGSDLRSVRIHTGPEADHLTRAVDAVAFTSGQDIFFRSGAYAPSGSDGFRLLAHETAHTVQQRHGPVTGRPMPGGIAVSEPGDPFERAADQTAAELVRTAGHRWMDVRPVYRRGTG
jgi:hypothetical protein